MTADTTPDALSVGGSDTASPNTPLRISLIAALAVAIAMGVLFFRSQGPFDKGDTFGALIGAETLSVIAIAVVLIIGGGPRRMAAAGLAFVAAIIPTCEGVAIGVFPGGAPPVSNPSGVSSGTSLILLVLANVTVMILASLQSRGDTRKAMFGLTGVMLVLIGVVKLLFR